jgi:endonuclease YncB( thermonuclease family)
MNSTEEQLDITQNIEIESKSETIQNTNLELATADTPEFTLNNQILNGKVVYVYDGDTVHIVFKIDNKLVKFNCRLLGIDTPEVAPKNISDKELKNQEVMAAYKSRDYLISRVSNVSITKNKMNKNDVKKLLAQSTKIMCVKCYDFDKYGRLLVELFEDSNLVKSINQDMIDNKHALGYDGGTKSTFTQENFNL